MLLERWKHLPKNVKKTIPDKYRPFLEGRFHNLRRNLEKNWEKILIDREYLRPLFLEETYVVGVFGNLIRKMG